MRVFFLISAIITSAFYIRCAALRSDDDDKYKLDTDDFELAKPVAKGKRLITGDVEVPEDKRVAQKKAAGGDTSYELMPLNYYASMDYERTHPLKMSEIRGTLTRVLKKDLFPLFGQHIAPPQKGWVIKVKLFDTRPDGAPSLAYVHLESSVADALVSFDPRNETVEILGVDPDLNIDPVAMGRLGVLLTNAAKNRREVVKDAFLSGRSKANFGLEFRRGIVCLGASVLSSPTVATLAGTEKTITMMTRAVLARVWETTPRQLAGGHKAPPRFQRLTEWSALGLEGSKPVHWRGRISRDPFSDSNGEVDDATIAKIREYSADLEAYNPAQLGCLDSDVLYQEGIRDVCISLHRLRPQDQSLMQTPEVFAHQCLGMYPSGSAAVYLHQRNVKGGIKSEYRQTVCRGREWGPQVSLSDDQGKAAIEECRRRQGRRGNSLFARAPQ